MSTPKETDSIHKEILGSGIADILTAPFKDAFGKMVDGKPHDDGPDKVAIVAGIVGKMLHEFPLVSKWLDSKWVTKLAEEKRPKLNKKGREDALYGWCWGQWFSQCAEAGVRETKPGSEGGGNVAGFTKPPKNAPKTPADRNEQPRPPKGMTAVSIGDVFGPLHAPLPSIKGDLQILEGIIRNKRHRVAGKSDYTKGFLAADAELDRLTPDRKPGAFEKLEGALKPFEAPIINQAKFVTSPGFKGFQIVLWLAVGIMLAIMLFNI